MMRQTQFSYPIWLKSTELIRKYLSLLRYEPGNFLFLPSILGLIITCLVLANLFMIFLEENDNLEKCTLAMHDILIVLGLSSCVMKRALNPDENIRLTRLIEEQFFVDRFRLDEGGTKWGRIRTLYDEKRKDLESACNTITIFMHGAYMGFVVKYIFMELLGTTHVEKSRGLPTPFTTHIPSDFEQIPFFIYMFALHTIFILVVSLEAFSGYALLWLCVKHIITDFETLYILLDEIGNDYPGFADEENIRMDEKQISDCYMGSINGEMRINAQYYQKFNRRDRADREKNLQKDMGLIVKFHQNLNRNQNDCAIASAYGIMVISFIVAMDTCFNIFLMLQTNNLKMFMNYATVCIGTNIPLLLNYYIGQQISNQNEIFRERLAELPWIEKPQWFKQSMLIMMTRANVDTEIKPYGVFVLNLNSYKDLLKAAFSFGNILYTRNQMTK